MLQFSQEPVSSSWLKRIAQMGERFPSKLLLLHVAFGQQQSPSKQQLLFDQIYLGNQVRDALFDLIRQRFPITSVTCLTLFIKKTSFLLIPLEASTLSKNFPARPTNGRPTSSSSVQDFDPRSLSLLWEDLRPERRFLHKSRVYAGCNIGFEPSDFEGPLSICPLLLPNDRHQCLKMLFG
jgi:hypothetical protein